ncbi:MAG: trypsin-like peptidase domain-containing protein [Gemmatimonadetes bacterium]|nr:trypsin-like peptidase domain-containing protein [Gemmatimonadota bacterium]
MKAQLHILSGARAGQIEVHSGSEITVGRHPSNVLRFDPERDLDVSTRHAVIARSGNSWVVRDLQSRNGTLVNGHRIIADTKLGDTDQIRFGAEGPAVEFRLVADSVPDTLLGTENVPTHDRPRAPAGGQTDRPVPAAAAAAPAARVTAGAPGGSTTQRIRVEVAKQTQKLRYVSTVLVVVLLVAVTGFFAFNYRQEQLRQAEATAMRLRVDSILRASEDAVKALQGQVAGLADALKGSQVQVQKLQTELASAQASGNKTQIADLSRRLTAASDVLRNQQAAAQVDYRGINAANQRSVALVWVKFGPREVYTGTAFAIRKDGIMVTNRHVVAGESGTRHPLDMALKFADSYQTFKASLVKISPETDLAIIKVENLDGVVPTVHGLNARPDTIQAGDPVAMIGFPLGVELPMGSEGDRIVAKTTFGAGIISKVLPDKVQIDGYSAQGASGSPIFDGNGDVVAVLYGGQEGTNGRVLYGVPASYVSKLLQSVN